MSGASLPSGHTARAPQASDAEAIAELYTAHSMAVIGMADCTLDDVRDYLSQPGFDISRDAVLVFDPAEQLVGFAWTARKSDSHEVDIDIVTTEPEVASWLVARATGRGRELAAERGHPRVILDLGVYQDDKVLRAELQAAGFTTVTTFHRMRIEHAGPLPEPEPPAGLTLLNARDAAVRPAAHEVYNTSFAEHFGFVPDTFEAWHESREKRSTFDWPQLWVAALDGRPVGVLECNDQYVADENCGYVGELGVLAEARGRGVAKYLLRYAFSVDSAAGRAGTILHVDSNNTTPALELYTSVGMRPVLAIDAWRRELPV